MNGDSVEISPGVYLVTGARPPTDGVLVDRSRAAAAWVSVADVTIDPRPGDDVERLVRVAARHHHLTVAAAISSARRRSAGSP